MLPHLNIRDACAFCYSWFQFDILNRYLSVQFARNLKKPGNSPFTWYLNETIFKRHNLSLEAAAVEMSELSPGQHVLEIGFGPGHGILFAAERVAPLTVKYLREQNHLQRVLFQLRPPTLCFPSDGHVQGVDISEYMVKHAMRLNKPLIRAGAVSLKLASVDHLPMLSSTIDACFHVNCFYFWHNLPYSLRQIWRVLRPNGRLVTTFRPQRLKRHVERGWLRYGRVDPVAYALALEACGFSQVEWFRDQVWTKSTDPYECIVARKPPIHSLPQSSVVESNVSIQ
ncbi:hypothetical protein EG68_09063 [Paragonimus skrjabini miyazakii]|uniref:Methyltransferase type 11 domain-containing protein n=1 Tax=Paragonimus skrjabini miyazakii TaxID=59628 RepID=A0A8S9YRQ9_9TREM|nr:hypothetical protein EG68_09063 [Paragonimus skrjabini miyazakii]